MSEWKGLWAICINDVWIVAYKDDDESGESWWDANHHTWQEFVGKEQRSIKLAASVTVEKPIP